MYFQKKPTTQGSWLHVRGVIKSMYFTTLIKDINVSHYLCTVLGNYSVKASYSTVCNN